MPIKLLAIKKQIGRGSQNSQSNRNSRSNPNPLQTSRPSLRALMMEWPPIKQQRTEPQLVIHLLVARDHPKEMVPREFLPLPVDGWVFYYKQKALPQTIHRYLSNSIAATTRSANSSAQSRLRGKINFLNFLFRRAIIYCTPFAFYRS